jgi:uncharacterized membrane protein
MSTAKKLSGLALATAAAGMFLAVGAMSPAMGAAHMEGEGKVKCEGVNACKGQSDCQTANTACKGQNSCKGQGFQTLSKKECEAAKAKMDKK